MSGAAAFTGAARLAGVAGAPVAHSLSPLIHNSWIAAAGLDAVYVPFAPGPDGFARLVRGLSGGAAAGLNVTAPFKAEALALADAASPAARAAGAANLLVFGEGGAVRADNTDGAGLLAALGEQAPAWRAEAGPAVVLGAGGAAAGAAAALLAAGAPQVRLVARNPVRGRTAAEGSDERLVVHAWSDLPRVLEDAALLVNATPLGLGGAAGPVVPWDRAPRNLAVVDMVYAPLRTSLLRAAAAHGLATVDGLAMLVGQARPSFEALFGRPPPPGSDVRALCLRALGEGGRPRDPPVIRLGLTGSIGMGKSTTAGLFAERGAPVYDADAAVHALYGFGGAAVDAVEAAFPGVVAHGVVDRARLGARVLDDPKALQRLEAVVHPLVGAHRAHFFEAVAGAAVVVLDVPLLFETGGEAWMDAVAVVSCPPELQRARVLARPGMTPEKLDAVLARQTPDADKRARADFVIDTSQGLDAARAQVAAVLAAVTALGFRPRAHRDPCAPSPGAP